MPGPRWPLAALAGAALVGVVVGVLTGEVLQSIGLAVMLGAAPMVLLGVPMIATGLRQSSVEMAAPPAGVVEVGQGGGTVRLHREHRGRADRLRAYQVEVDGRAVAGVRAGESTELRLPAGEHTVRLRLDWATSRRLALRLADGEVVRLRCWPRANPVTALFWVLIGFRRAIRLGR
jgi:hypothetical protein